MFTLLIALLCRFHVSEPDARFPKRGNCGSRAVAGRTLLRNTGKRSHKSHNVYLIMWRPLSKLLPNKFPTIILKSGLKKQRTASLYNVKCLMHAEAGGSVPHRFTASLPDLKKHWLLKRQMWQRGIVSNTLVCIRTWFIWSQFFWGSQGSTAFPGFCCAASKILLCSVKSLLMAQPRSTRLPSFKVQMERGKIFPGDKLRTPEFLLTWGEDQEPCNIIFTALRAIESSCCCCGIVNIAYLYQ